MRIMTVNEWLMLITLAFLLPVIIGLLTAVAFGLLRSQEDVKYIVLQDPEPDYWGEAPTETHERRKEAP